MDIPYVVNGLLCCLYRNRMEGRWRIGVGGGLGFMRRRTNNDRNFSKHIKHNPSNILVIGFGIMKLIYSSYSIITHHSLKWSGKF